MFLHARQHIAANTFAAYKEHITKQCELYKALPDRYKAQNTEESNNNRNKKLKKDEEKASN